MCVCLLPPSLKVFAPPFRVDSMRPFSWTPRKSHPKWSSCLETFAPSNIMWSLSSDTVNGPLGHLGRENPFPSTAACVLSATGGSREKENCFEQNVHSLWPSLSKPGHVVVQLFQLCIAYCSCMGDLCYATCTFIPLPLTLWLKGKGTVLFFFFHSKGMYLFTLSTITFKSRCNVLWMQLLYHKDARKSQGYKIRLTHSKCCASH